MRGWERVALGDVAAIERTIVEAAAIAPGTPYVGLENIEPGGTLHGVRKVERGDLASSKFAFTPRHVLYGKLRPYLAKVARPGFDGVCSTDLIPILPGSRLDRNYLAHFLLSPTFVAWASSQATGANLPRISPKQLELRAIPLPALPDQRRIAEILDRADELRSIRRGGSDQLNALIYATFLAMFGDPSFRPLNRSLMSVGEVADVQGGLQLTSARSELPREVPYLRVANVHRGCMDLREIKTMRVTDSEFARTRLLDNDLLLVEGHGNPDEIGRCALWDASIPDCVHQNHLIRARFDARVIEPQYALAYLNSRGGRQHLLRSGKTTSGLNTISVSEVRATPIAVPDRGLQSRFAARVSAIEKLKAGYRASLVQLDALFASLQDRAFTGRL